METMEYELFQAFERREYIHMDDLPLLINYICRDINSDYSANRGYYNVSKLAIVCFRKSWLLFALGNKNTVYQLFLVKERQFVTMNLLIFLKINNIKIVVVQQFNLLF